MAEVADVGRGIAATRFREAAQVLMLQMFKSLKSLLKHTPSRIQSCFPPSKGFQTGGVQIARSK